MKVFFFPIISISISFSIGIILFYYTNLSWLLIAICILTSLIGYYVINFLKLKNKILSFLLLMLFWLCIGIFTAKIHNKIEYKNHYTNFIFKQNNNIAKIVITERLKPSIKNDKFYASITSINNENSIGNILVYIPKNDSIKYNIGDKLLYYGDFDEISQPKNPYEFSYADYLKKQQVYHQVFVTNNLIKIGIHKNLDYYINKLRESLINSFSIHSFNDETQQFVNAFIFGQRQEISDKLNNDYTNAGVVHILAISGLHIAILYGLVLYTFKTLRWGYNKRFLKLVISILFLWTFALITGMSASVVRSVTMFTIMAIAMTYDKNQNIYNSMAISFLVILLLKPNFIFDVGFQLSYLSVFIIIVCNPLYKKLHFTKYKIVHLTMDIISISLCAQLFLLPLILYYFHQFPTLFLVANLIVIPLSNLILYGLVILLILNYVIPNLAIWFGKVIEILITLLNKYIGFIASNKSFVIENIPFNSILLCTSYLVIIALILNIFKTNYNRIKFLFIAIILFQIGLIYSMESEKNNDELIIWNQNRNTILTFEKNNQINICTTNDSVINRFVNNISQNNFNKEIIIKPLQNYFYTENKKILLLNSEHYLVDSLKVDYLILTNSPKINLERIITSNHPKVIIADASNYKSYIENWKKTCYKKNIPFHTTYEMGYYTIKK